MALAILFRPRGMTSELYDRTIERLEAAGAGAPRGRRYHVCYGDDDDLRVLDVWESRESFEEFGQTLMPILQELGVDPGEPDIRPAHNVIEG
jgi:hypothetical protein